MDIEREQRHDKNMLQAYQRRLHALEVQAAERGSSTPAEIRVEIEDIRTKIGEIALQLKAEVTGEIIQQNGSVQRQLRKEAFEAYLCDSWLKAEELFQCLLHDDPDDQEAQGLLVEVRQKLNQQNFFDIICKLYAEGDWRAVLKAAELRQLPPLDYPGLTAMLSWAKQQQNQEEYRIAILASMDGVITNLKHLSQEQPDNAPLRSLLVDADTFRQALVVSLESVSGHASMPKQSDAGLNKRVRATEDLGAYAER
jgi:hypothetical protein